MSLAVSWFHPREIMPDKINLAEAFSGFSDYYNPRIAGDINDMQIKLVRLKGEFMWHHHEQEDELFLVVRGKLLMRFRDKDVRIEAGEFIIVPHGVEHMPVSESEECEIVLLEPKSTLNTGNVVNERTRRELEHIG
jgi:mannose-6-phosphate isomerase-like protein (cupin superfamily)